MNYGRAKEYGPQGCQVPVGNGKCGETKTLVILNEFKTLYEKRMEQLDAEIRAGGDCLQEKMSLQEQWIRDLMEQNEMMARTVEQLEIEATERVQMLEQKLQSSAKCICEVMKRYREYSSSLHLDEPFQKMFYVENDMKNLLEFIRRIREDNRWSIEGLQFYDITYKDLFGDKGCANDCPAISAKNVDHATKQEEKLEEKERKIDTLSKDTERISLFGDPEKLSEKLKIKDNEFKELKQSMLDMRKALTEEVASKHDVICALKRDIQQLEEQCVQADKQIAFKEDIIKELRKELKQFKQQAYEETLSAVSSLEHENDRSKRDFNILQKELNNVKSELKSSLENSQARLNSTLESLNASSHISDILECLSSIGNSPKNNDIHWNIARRKDLSSAIEKMGESNISIGLLNKLMLANDAINTDIALFDLMEKEIMILKEHIAMKDKALLDQLNVINVLATKLYEINTNLDVLEANVAKYNTSVLEENNAAVKSSLTSYKKENDALKEKISEEKRQIADLEKQFKNFLAEKEELKKKLKDAKTNAENATENMAKNENICKKYAKEMNKLKDDVERLEKELELTKKDKKDLQSQINDLEYENSRLKKDKQKMVDEAKDKDKDKDKDKNKDKDKDKDKDSDVSDKVEDLEKKIKALESELKDAKKSKDKFSNECADLKMKIAELTAKIMDLEKEKPSRSKGSSKKKALCVCKMLPNKCLEISEKCEVHNPDSADANVPSVPKTSPKPLSKKDDSFEKFVQAAEAKVTIKPQPNVVLFDPKLDQVIKESAEDESLSSFDRAYRNDMSKFTFPDLDSDDDIRTKDEIIKVQSDTLNILQLKLQEVQNKSIKKEKENEKKSTEIENLSNKVCTLEARLIDCQGRADNLQTAVDFYVNSINVLEAAEERARIEIEQQKLTILNLQEALVSTKQEFDELKQSQKEEVSLGWAARWLGTGVSKPTNNNNPPYNHKKPVHDI